MQDPSVPEDFDEEVDRSWIVVQCFIALGGCLCRALSIDGFHRMVEFINGTPPLSGVDVGKISLWINILIC